MKIAFVSIENSLTAIGFRKMAALTRALEPELEVLFIVPFRAASPLNRLRAKPYQHKDDSEIEAIASHLAKSDLVCFSSMSTHAEYTQSLIRAVRSRNPRAFIVWGGIHAIVHPEDASQHADAVCAGEGEKAFPEFLSLFREGRDHTHVGNFLFRSNGQVVRNPLLPLQTAQELGSQHYPLLGDGELLYKPREGFVPLRALDYVRHEGLAYNVVWSIGCPNRCVYCGNSRFLDNHKDYGRLRFPPVDHIIGQIAHARERYPHLSSVTFHDDMFMAIPLPTLEEFAEKWRALVRLPFAVLGLMSRYVDVQKMKALISAGMFRVRMGVQSGSPQTLKFYKRPDTPESIERAIGVIRRFSKHMMTPSYDLIVDNPLETVDDIVSTVDLLYRLPRPFILNVFPLMVITGTELETIMAGNGIELPDIKQGQPSNSYANALILMLCLARPPRRIYEHLRKRLIRKGTAAKVHPAIMQLLLSAINVKRALAHLRVGHLAVLPSSASWFFYKKGLLRGLNRRILRKCMSVSAGSPEQV